MRIIFTREKDGATFEFGDFQNNFVIDKKTKIPQPADIDATGYEFSGAHGGYNTAGRYQRRAFDLFFVIREKTGDPRGIISLIASGRAFFAVADDDLSANLFTADFYTDDKQSASFRIRHGAITVPFSAPFADREKFANGSMSLVFGDPFTYFLGSDGSAVGGIVDFSLFPTGATPTLIRGRKWTTSGAVWTPKGTVWQAPSGGGGGNQTTVLLVTENTVHASFDILGTITNPVIVNTTDGSQFSYIGTVADGQTLTVSTDGIVLLGGLPAPGTWSGILTARNGLNSFVLQSSSSNANSRANIRLRGNF